MTDDKENNDKRLRRLLRKKREKEFRITTILAAAEKLFAKKGYQQTSIEEIADNAEISTGTVYLYFKNKEEILIKLIHDIGNLADDVLWNEFEDSDYSLTAFNSLGLSFITKFCLAYPEKNIIFFRESIGQSTNVEDHRKQVLIELTSGIKKRLKKVYQLRGIKSIADSSYELIAVHIVGIYSHIACHYLIWQDQSGSIVDIAHKTSAFLFGGIGHLLMMDNSMNPKREKGQGQSVKPRKRKSERK